MSIIYFLIPKAARQPQFFSESTKILTQCECFNTHEGGIFTLNLPFLKNKNIAGAIMTTKVRSPDAPESTEDQENQGLIAAAKDLITAIQAGDEKAVAQALQAAFQICDSQPHDEGEHLNEESPE